tara:strand:+ start:1111 stop:1539 length:429 start_codon:yes stop_codon:yes gene_type:complete
VRFFYSLFFIINFLVPSVNSSNQLFKGIDKCKINQKENFSLNLRNESIKNSKISVTSSVKIRNRKIKLAISEAKLKAKKKLINFLKKESFNNQIVKFSNNSFNYELRGAIVTQICIQNGDFLNLTLEIHDRSITNSKKIKNF